MRPYRLARIRILSGELPFLGSLYRRTYTLLRNVVRRAYRPDFWVLAFPW